MDIPMDLMGKLYKTTNSSSRQHPKHAVSKRRSSCDTAHLAPDAPSPAGEAPPAPRRLAKPVPWMKLMDGDFYKQWLIVVNDG
jgi:hypothetical protein